jgi:16S rRNA G966 N2-methylase RsmD
MEIWTRIKREIGRAHDMGIGAFTGELLERLLTRYYERRLGVRTTGKVYLPQLGIDSPLSVHYYPTDYRTLRKIFRFIPIRPNEDVFLDFGSGMGRVALFAATYPFRRVIGIELSSDLNEIANRNITSARTKLQCKNIELVTQDATRFQVPHEATIIFFYCPFRGEMLRTVLENVRRSWEEHPRGIVIVFKNTADLDRMEWESWLSKRWQFKACDASHEVAIFETRCTRDRQ